MRKLKLLLATCALLGGAFSANAQTDVTSTYLTNADFSGTYSTAYTINTDRYIYQPNGWTVDYKNTSTWNMTVVGSTDNMASNFTGDYAVPADNNKYMVRFRDNNNDEYVDLSQTITVTEEGYYVFSADLIRENGSKIDVALYAGNNTVSNSTAGTWENRSFAVTLAANTEIKVGLKFTNKGADGVRAGADNVKIMKYADYDTYLRIQNNLTEATYANPIVTNFVTNGTFDSNINGWQHTAEVWSNNVANNQAGAFTGNFYENWDGSAKVNKMYQTISNIPNGTYRLDIAAFVNTLADPNESQYVFANNDKTYLTSVDPTAYEVYTVVTDNQIEIGLEQTTATANWMGIDNVSLRYYGAGDVINDAQNASHKLAWEEAKAAAEAAIANSVYANVTGSEKTALQAEIAKAEPSTAQGYDDAAAALTSATSAFIAAKDNWDALVREITKATALGASTTAAVAVRDDAATTSANALAATQALKVVEYNYVSTTYSYSVPLSDTWNSTGTNTSAATFSNQHWSGETHEYKNQNDAGGQGWNANTWSISFNQDVTLPAGNYVFKVAGRQAAGNQVTTSLVVKLKQATDNLGTVSDFPRGNSALGINKEGETSFDPTDAKGFANDGNGYGWEWRYVKFTLDNDATVNIAINSNATAYGQWVSFGDYTLQTDNNANIALIAYNIALNSANTVLANDTYTNVGGTDKSNLEAAINADPGSTAEAINDATAALDAARETFTAGVDSWNAYVSAKNKTYPKDQPYASDEKYNAIAAVWSEDPATASEAATKAAAITSAYRAYVESNALAEGVTGSVNNTSLISNPNMTEGYNGTDHTFGAWQVIGQTDGTISLKTESDEPLTDSEGNKYKYADIWKSDNNGGIQQTLENLPAGKYMLTAAARAQNTDGATFGLFAGSARTEIPRNNNTGGVFGNGWNDVSLEFYVTETSNVNIGVQSGNGRTMWWGATRFRLVKLADVEVISEDASYTVVAGTKSVVLNRTIKAADTWNTFVVPFDITNDELKAKFGSDVAVAEYSDSESENKIYFNTMETPAITANKPVLLKTSTAGTSYTFDNRVITVKEGGPKVTGEIFDFIGTYAPGTIEEGDYFISGNLLVQAEGNENTINGMRAYIKAKSAGARIAGFFIDGVETTNIEGVSFETADGRYYNLNGQRVTNPKKGLYIVNGKKVVVK